MKRSPWRRCAQLLLVGAAAASPLARVPAGAAQTARESRPNIILILADDLGYSDLGCFGSEFQTPNIDSLAKRGMRFTHFYNNAVCCPTRASLLTGLYPHQAGVGWMVYNGADRRPEGPYQGYLNQRCVTLAEVLRTAGYRTFMSGKWHVGESRPHWPVDRGFDRSFALISGAANYFDLAKDYIPSVRRQMVQDAEPYQPPALDFHLTDAIADHAAAFLANLGNDPRPFFLYLPFTAPHAPLQATPGDIAANRNRHRDGWDRARQARFERMQAGGIVGRNVELSPRDPEVPPWSDASDPELEDLKVAIYASQVESMDRGIGRVLEALRRTGREEQTLVIFLSDNGAYAGDVSRFRSPELNRPPFLGGPDSFASYGRPWANVSNTPYRNYKTTMFEGGIITPLIVAGPGVDRRGNGISHDVGHVIDLMPTLAELAGATYPQQFAGHEILPLEGVSLVAAWRGDPRPRSRPLFWEFEGNYAVRDGDWKLIGAENQPWQLYNLSTDSTELRDVAAAEPERVRQMAELYAAWAKRCHVQAWSRISGEMQNVPGVR